MDMSLGMGMDDDPIYKMLLSKLTKRERMEGKQPLAFKVETGKGGQLPTRGHVGDAGFDLYVSERTVVLPGEFVDVPCGVSCELPDGHWGLIIGRSSTLRNRGLMVTQGIIDHGYRGELFAGVWNLRGQESVIQAGDRVAQFIVLPLIADQLVPVQVAELSEHSRGTSGFGSTGA